MAWALATGRTSHNWSNTPIAPFVVQSPRARRTKLRGRCSSHCQSSTVGEANPCGIAAVPVMPDDDVVALWSRVRMLERQWWSRARRDPQLVRFCAEQGLMPENMMVHGEVLFCLAGLKPAVIVTGLPPAMMEEFVGSVLLAAGLNGFLAVLALFARAKDVSLTRSSRGNPARSPSNRLGRCQRSCSISPVPPSRIVLEDRL